MGKILNIFGYICFWALVILLVWFILSYIPILCIPFIFDKIILTVFATLSVGFTIKYTIDKKYIKIISDKLSKNECIEPLTIIDILQQLNRNDNIFYNEIIENTIIKIDSSINKCKKNKKYPWNYFILKHNLEIFKKIQNKEITPKEAYNDFLFNLCESYSQIKDELSEEDRQALQKNFIDILNFK